MAEYTGAAWHDAERLLVLDEHRLLNVPSSMYYIPNFITAEEEAAILEAVSINLPLSAMQHII